MLQQIPSRARGLASFASLPPNRHYAVKRPTGARGGPLAPARVLLGQLKRLAADVPARAQCARSQGASCTSATEIQNLCCSHRAQAPLGSAQRCMGTCCHFILHNLSAHAIKCHAASGTGRHSQLEAVGTFASAVSDLTRVPHAVKFYLK